MDQIARNNLGALYFDNVAPAFHNLTRLAKHSNASPKRVLLHPPEPSTSYSREQKKPTNIFKKLVPKLETSLPLRARNGRKACDVQWTMVTPSMILSNAPTSSQAPSAEICPPSSIYSPQSALLDALGLAYKRVISVETLSYSQPKVVRFASSIVKPTQSQARILRRKSRYPVPMAPSPPPQTSQATPAPIGGKSTRCTPGHPLRKPSSSSRRTSRSIMVGHNPIGVSVSNNKKPTYTCRRQSIFSSLSAIIQAAEIDQPLLNAQRRSSRHIQALRRKSKVLPPASAKLILPPVEIHPLTFSPFLTEFSDHASSIGGSSAPSTPSINTPTSDIASVLSISPQKEARDQKNRRRYGRCPSTFLDLGPSSPLAFFIEQKRMDTVLATPPSTPPPPRSDSLRGCSKASLEKAKERAERTRALLRPRLTLQIPPYRHSSHSPIVHRPVASIRQCTDDIKVNTRRSRPLPLIPITRQQSM